MLTLGFSGGIDGRREQVYDFPFNLVHDSAAALVRDGEVVAAIEQERLNRIKHTNKSAGPAMRFCLEYAGVTLEDVDAIAFYATEDHVTNVLRLLHLTSGSAPTPLTARDMVQRIVTQEFGRGIDPSRIRFVEHHWAHAVSAYFMSGFDDALVMTLDGQGEGVSGMAFSGRGRELTMLRSIPVQHSLGFLYRDVIRLHGYELFDEYKVMGLAPYGDAARFRRLFGTLYELLSEGHYRLHLDRVPELYQRVHPRAKGEPFSQDHLDLAAGLQEALDIVGGHLVRHFAQATGHRRLCLAGGVAHNCSMNGRIVYSGLFDRVFVQPAAHDAGCALGAALAVHLEMRPDQPVAPLRHVFWGSDLPMPDALSRELDRWSGLVIATRQDDIAATAARLIADGRVIGWVQGRSEFGPRALGNRSILADPRPPEHKDIINRMVKKRESYRPFAPSVLLERVREFFVVPPTQSDFPYMSVVLDVQPDKRTLLGAVTHVDGTARVQTVNQASNERYWRLIDQFGQLTGVPVVLNTSFNNHAEPIVDSVLDAIVCFLTTDLQALAVGDFLVEKREASWDAYLSLRVSLPPTVALRASVTPSDDGPVSVWDARFTQHGGKSISISEESYRALARADESSTLGELFDAACIDAARRPMLVDELKALWSARAIQLAP